MADEPTVDLDAAVEALYAGDPGAFVAERDRLVKQLRAQKRRDEAKGVAALRRPTVAAWALNRAARALPDDVEELLDAGQELRRAQEAALAGDASGLRTATERRRAVNRRLVAEALDALADQVSDPSGYREELGATLDAASLDDELAQELRSGRLTRTAEPPSGLELFAGLEPPARRPARSGGGRKRPAEAPAERREEELRELRRAAEEAAREADAAEEQLRAAEEEVHQAEAALERARAAAERARDAAEQARAAAGGAAEALERAERAGGR